MKKTYLTKSRFKAALSCQTKLYYLLRPNEYRNNDSSNEFLQALAAGGYQVGELAKYLYPGGIEVDSSDHDEAVRQTDELMKRKNVTIYEGAFRHEHFFIRADIIRKTGNTLELVEVKSIAIDPSDGIESFLRKTDWKKGVVGITGGFREYMYDVAFQAMVVGLAYPGLMIKPHLMAADKTATATVDGLHQLFKISHNNGRIQIVRDVATVNAQSGDRILGNSILTAIDVSVIVESILAGKETTLKKIDGWPNGTSFRDFATDIARKLQAGTKISTKPSTKCKACEFRCADQDGLKSGFNECWKPLLGDKLGEPMVFDIWKLNNSQHDYSADFIKEGKYLISQLSEADITPPESTFLPEPPAWSPHERKLIQLRKVLHDDSTPAVQKEGLRAAMNKWRFPIHFVDFETSTAAIPFNKGRRPYEIIAFQFSHHTIDAAGNVTHAGQYLHTTPGEFPNFSFIRELRKQLSADDGTIIRYADHENSVLRTIRAQLDASSEADRKDLIAWIDTITEWSIGKKRECGQRNMVDLAALLRKFYYHPATNGSCSLKAVLPAIIAESKFLRDKYSKPVYGGPRGSIRSLNFKDTPMAWFQKDLATGKISDPYTLLGRVLPELNLPDESADDVASEGEGVINNGGLAMMAYYAMQFMDMDPKLRKETCAQLLQYCELDTLAMVMLYEHFRELAG